MDELPNELIDFLFEILANARDFRSFARFSLTCKRMFDIAIDSDTKELNRKDIRTKYLGKTSAHICWCGKQDESIDRSDLKRLLNIDNPSIEVKMNLRLGAYITKDELDGADPKTRTMVLLQCFDQLAKWQIDMCATGFELSLFDNIATMKREPKNQHLHIFRDPTHQIAFLCKCIDLAESALHQLSGFAVATLLVHMPHFTAEDLASIDNKGEKLRTLIREYLCEQLVFLEVNGQLKPVVIDRLRDLEAVRTWMQKLLGRSMCLQVGLL